MLPDHFPGQHEDERVLYFVRPDPAGRLYVILQAFVCLVLVALALMYGLTAIVRTNPLQSFRNSYTIAVLVTLVLFGWRIYKLFCWRAYITDRRFVRFEAIFPGFVNRRSLLWENVGKVKSISQGPILRFCKIGTLELHASFERKENIFLPYVYYYEDLANYVEKLLHTYKKAKEDLPKIRPFVTRPKWQRYPVDEAETVVETRS